MKELLFLVHRIPYPPNKGDKIRSYHILKHLSKFFRVHVGAFVDDPDDWRYAGELGPLCGELKLLPLPPVLSKLRSLAGLLTGEALTLPYYRNREMGAWVDAIVRERPLAGILVFSSAMSQYVRGVESLPRVIDFVDVDSDKWRQYAEHKAWPMSWIYRRESRCLLQFDRAIAHCFDQSLFVSEDESALFRRLAPECAHAVFTLENGVDTEYFDGGRHYANPYPPGSEVLVFTGAMDYWANVDAVVWMAKHIFPEVLRQRPAAQFYIVGSRPNAEALALADGAGVVVTGAVEDIRPYLAHARLALAPMRIARGVQNKVLEAMAMGKSLLATPAAIEGIEISGQLDIKIADAPDAWAELICDALGNMSLSAYSLRNREFVMRRYGWDHNLQKLDQLWECA
ncbi:MAG: TIGR03087 family PEP-CTERM/XrtA system glycosyltransferase [Candidatus Methylumidiphilus sp.]